MSVEGAAPSAVQTYQQAVPGNLLLTFPEHAFAVATPPE